MKNAQRKESQDLYKRALKEVRRSNPNVENVIHDLIKSSELGNSEATYALATWYLHGKYVETDLYKGVDLLRKASESNNSDALYDLAVCYEEGKGVKKNQSEAFRLYIKAMLYGDEQSIFEIGRCYYYGIGIPKNLKLGDVWIKRAEELGID